MGKRLEYETFKKAVTEKFLDYMPEKYHNHTVRVDTVRKTNQTLDGLGLVAKVEGKCCSPRIYIQDLYEYYQQNGKDLDKTLRFAVDTMNSAYEKVQETMGLDIDFCAPDRNIVFQFVNTAKNLEWLKEIPHRPFLDLSVIYRFMISSGKDTAYSIVITNTIAEQMGMSEEQLYQEAYQTTRVYSKPVLKTLAEFMFEVTFGRKMPESLKERETEEMPMYLLTNESKMNGASYLLYQDLVSGLAEKLGKDLCILPSSIHEMFLVPIEDTDMDMNGVSSIIQGVNKMFVNPEDCLSDHPYIFRRATGAYSSFIG